MGNGKVVSYTVPGTFLELFYGVRSPCLPLYRATQMPNSETP